MDFKPLGLITANVNESWEGEFHEETKWDGRFPRIVDMLKYYSEDVDIICLQELRNLDTSSNKLGKTIGTIVDNLESPGTFSFVPCYYSEHVHSNVGAIIYRRNRLRLHGTKLIHCDNREDPKPPMTSIMPRCFLCADFEDILFKERFLVICVHFPLRESDKWFCLEKLKSFCSKVTKKYPHKPILSIGDYNFFDDMDGKAMRTSMLEIFQQDLAFPLFSIEKGNKIPMSGSFIGYSYDKFISDMTPDENGNRYGKMSRLDHMFSSNCEKVNDAIALLPPGEEEINGDTNPSDHVMIYCKAHFSKK